MKKSGLKFTEKYGVESATIYKGAGDLESLQIPPKDHVLFDPTAPTTYDPIRVEAIDRDGHMTSPIEVWTDPDAGILWVLDGRGRTLDVTEVNRRRAKEGREPVKPYLVPFNGDEKAAVARVREKNYHRRAPTTSGLALDLHALRKAGHSWEACARVLHVETDDAEQWGRRILPLAFCVPEVREAVDSGKLSKGAAKKFGGGAADGEKALGKKEQIALLEAMNKEKVFSPAKPKAVPTKSRERVYAALTNGASEHLDEYNKIVAQAFAAGLAFTNGDTKALKAWPDVAAVIETAMKPLVRGPKPKAEKAPKAKKAKKAKGTQLEAAA